MPRGRKKKVVTIKKKLSFKQEKVDEMPLLHYSVYYQVGDKIFYTIVLAQWFAVAEEKVFFHENDIVTLAIANWIKVEKISQDEYLCLAEQEVDTAASIMDNAKKDLNELVGK